MKIIHFIASIDKSSGGTTTYMRQISNELSKFHDIIIATSYSSNPVTIDSVRIKFFNTKLYRWFSLQNEFSDFLIAENPDIVHINGIWNPENYLFQRTAKNQGIRTILSPHGMLEPYIMSRNPLKKKTAMMLYQHKAIQSVDLLHATATSELNNINNLGYRQTSVVIPNGIDLNEFPLDAPEKLKAPKKILFLSRIHPKKGIEFLIRAWSQLTPEVKQNWRIEIIGNGDLVYIDKLKKKIQNLGMIDQMMIMPPVFGPDKIKIMREASLFVLPTHSENFGIVVAEALASNTPVITTEGTPWEELNSYNAGWWIEVGTEPLRKTLEIAMKIEEGELIKMGLNGRNLIEANYSIEAISEKMIQFYHETL